MTSTTVSPETFLVDPAHAVGEEFDPFTDLERRVSALEDLVTGHGGVRQQREASIEMEEAWEHATERSIVVSEQLADLEAKHDVVLQLVERIAGIVKKSTSRVSLEVKAAIDEWANPQTPSPAPEPSHSEPQPEPIPAASTEASAGEGPADIGPYAPNPTASVDEWRAFAEQFPQFAGQPINSMNRSQIRTMLGIEQPVGA